MIFILQQLYDLIWSNFFSGISVPVLSSCAVELCSLFSVALMVFCCLIPVFLVFGFIKWVWRLFDR